MELKNIKAAFFDLDGTLIDTEKIYVKCWKKAGDICGFPMEMDRVYTLRSTDHQLATEKFAIGMVMRKPIQKSEQKEKN